MSMESMQEEKFNQLITSIIHLHPLIPTKAVILEYLKTESDHYYDVFCDKIFQFLNFHDFHRQLEGLVYITDNPFLAQPNMSLYMDNYGRMYLSPERFNYSHLKLRLLSSADIDLEQDDIIYYIDIALERMEKYLCALLQAEEANKYDLRDSTISLRAKLKSKGISSC